MKPFFKGSLALSGWLSIKKTLYAYVLVYVFPVDPLAFADKPPVSSLFRTSVLKPGIPTQRDRYSAPITKVNGQGILG